MLSGDREKRPQRLAEIRDVLERHKGERLPSFSTASSPVPVDPHAATVLTPDTAPRAPASVPDPAPRSNQADLAGTDTSDPVSLLAARPSPATKRVVVALSLAVLAAVGGTVLLRATSDRPRAVTAIVTARAGEPTSALPPAPKELTSATPVTLSSSVAVESASAPTAAPPPRVAAPAVSVRVQAAAPVEAGSPIGCEAREVLSNGHCCPVGLAWQFDRCERPIATKF
jgi:hypothetical protein